MAAGLAERMRRLGIDVVTVREPGGTPAAEHIRQALLDRSNHFTPTSELLFMTAARSHLVETVIRPALEAGRVVLADRFDLSTRAYQGAGRGLDAAVVDSVNRVATGGLQPDLTLVLDIPEGVGQERQRAAGKDQDRLDRESADFHARVVGCYRAAAGPGVRHIDASISPAEVLEASWAALSEAAPQTFAGRPASASLPGRSV